jgi:hypothetical protein
MADELEANWAAKTLTARGTTVIMVIAVVVLAASNFYAGYLIQQTITRENTLIADELRRVNGHADAAHALILKNQERIRLSLDRTSCVVAMGVDERTWFRKTYQPGSFIRACPWIDE